MICSRPRFSSALSAAKPRSKQGMELLQKERKRIQGLVGRAVVLKYTPQLRFVLDESISRGNRVLEILEEIERSSPPNEGSPEDH